MQKYSSKNTSVNTKKLARVWNCLKYYQNLPLNVMDYGCGRAWGNTQAFLQKQVNELNYYPYDPFWVDSQQNLEARKLLNNNQIDLCVCANVLNVIQEDDIVRNIIAEVVKAKYWVIQIYEGDKQRQGRVSKEDCYQRNQKIVDYLQYFPEEWTARIFIHKGFMTNNYKLIK